jgi:hypothetical protein
MEYILSEEDLEKLINFSTQFNSFLNNLKTNNLIQEKIVPLKIIENTEYISVREYAKLINVNRNTVYYRIIRGTVKSYLINGIIKIKKSEITIEK